VLLPYNYPMMQIPEYASSFESLITACEQRRVAVQTIKRWRAAAGATSRGKRFSWYEPLKDREAIRRAVHYALSRTGFFLNSSSDASLLPTILDMASEAPQARVLLRWRPTSRTFAMQPLFRARPRRDLIGQGDSGRLALGQSDQHRDDLQQQGTCDIDVGSAAETDPLDQVQDGSTLSRRRRAMR